MLRLLYQGCTSVNGLLLKYAEIDPAMSEKLQDHFPLLYVIGMSPFQFKRNKTRS